MRSFNDEFNSNEQNNKPEENSSENKEPEVSNTPHPDERPSNERTFGQFINNNQTVKSDSVDENSEKPSEVRNEAPGTYSYTGEKLTDNVTSFGGSMNNNAGVNQPDRVQLNNPGDNTPYNMPQMNGNGEISYTPNENPKKSKKKAEKKKPHTVQFTKAGVAVLCCATICLSAAAGFLGAYAASSAVSSDTVTNVNDNSNSENKNNGNAVIYRSVSTNDLVSSQNGKMTYKNVADLVQDSVVEIVTEYNNVSLWFQYVTSGAGSGVILSEDGYIITNNHVISSESTNSVADNITVRLRNGEEYKAEVIGADADSDVAVLKIDATGLSPAVCGNSENLAVGEEVLAVGNPLGELGGTVTNGIISATDREIVVGSVTMNLIQTNAAVNPGNSGGGLFNMSGELIGIVNAKSSGSDVEGLGFAIPVKDALSVAEQLLEYGYVRGKVMIGVTFLDATDDYVAKYYGLKTGIYVSGLTEGYNDQNLKTGDRVIAVNGNEVNVYEDITSVVKSSSVGDIIKFQVYRDGKLTEVNVEVFEKVPESVSDVNFEEESVNDSESNSKQPSQQTRLPW